MKEVYCILCRHSARLEMKGNNWTQEDCLSGPILCEIENADRKRKTAFFDLDFSIRKKKLSYLKKIYIFFSDRKIQIEKRHFFCFWGFLPINGFDLTACLELNLLCFLFLFLVFCFYPVFAWLVRNLTKSSPA